jgi:alcohol dehydrogenase
MDFTYHMPTKVRFGRGAFGEAGKIVDELGARRILVVTGRGGWKDRLLGRLDGMLEGREVDVFDEVEADPSVGTVDSGAAKARHADAIVALGGGSPLDAAKAISVVAGNGGGAAEYLAGKKTPNPGPPVIAVPTTAGTGSEVTEVSVLTDREKGLKKSFRSVRMYPYAALDDPELTATMPKDVTAATGLDALTHAVEAYTSTRSQPIPDALCREAAKLILGNIVAAFEDGGDMDAREGMLLGSLMAGFGITHSGAGLAHGLSYSLWKVAGTHHGLACGALLPHVMRFNLGREGGRYAALAGHCGFKSPEALISRVEEVNARLGVPSRLGPLGVGESDVESMLELGLGGSTRVNPRLVDRATLASFIRRII